METKEIWCPIEGYEGLYEVSNLGNVRSLGNKKTKKTKILKQNMNTSGYLRVYLCKNGKQKQFKVHRLVAEAFIPNLFGYPQVNHIDEDKTNNHIDNLEWCDNKYNSNHGTRNKRISVKNINGKCSKPILQLTETGEFLKEYPSLQEAGRNGFNIGNICACCRGERKTHKGYIWKYK